MKQIQNLGFCLRGPWKKGCGPTPTKWKIYKKKLWGQNVCFFLGRPCSWARSVWFLKARGFVASISRRGVFPEKKLVLFVIYVTPCFYDFGGKVLEKKASRLLPKNEKLRTTSSGARMFTFSWGSPHPTPPPTPPTGDKGGGSPRKSKHSGPGTFCS